MELQQADKIAATVIERLKPFCRRRDDGYVYIEIAGSIRRQKPNVGDIELLCVPKYDGGIDQLDWEIGLLTAQGILSFRRNKLGSRVYGPKNKLMIHVPSGIGVDIFSTTDECWAVSLVVRTGGAETNKRIAMAALRKGWHWHAYGRGFTTPDGELVCRSEREVFEAVGMPYLPPEQR